MKWLRSAILAFSFFSSLPMPKINWSKENLSYTAGFFPLIGATIALFLRGWLWLCSELSLGPIIFAAGLVILPVAITGGIHLDGFSDTVDALSSRADQEKKRKILADPHIGAFAVISLLLYFLLYFALATEIRPTAANILSIGMIHVLSRILIGFGILSFPSLKQEGLFYFLKSSTAKKATAALLVIFFILASLSLYFLLGWYFLALIAATALYSFYILFKFKREFAGINGDLAGFWLQTLELLLLAVLIIIEKVSL